MQENKKANAKEALIDAALKLFVEKGYQAVSTRELAELAEVNLGAIQYHFGSKAKLFVAAIHSMMQCSEVTVLQQSLEGSIKSKEEAAATLCKFIHSFMSHLLRPVGPHACKLIFREILSDSAQDPELSQVLVSEFVENYSKPLQQNLARVVSKIDPEASALELQGCAHSIVGQCAFYVTHQPFIEKLQGIKLAASPAFDDSVRIVARFSLRALGCSDAFVKKTIDAELTESR